MTYPPKWSYYYMENLDNEQRTVIMSLDWPNVTGLGKLSQFPVSLFQTNCSPSPLGPQTHRDKALGRQQDSQVRCSYWLSEQVCLSNRSDRVATCIKKYIYRRNSKHLFWMFFAFEGCLPLQLSVTSVLLVSLLLLCLRISVKKRLSPKQILCYKSQSTFVICHTELYPLTTSET